MNGIAIDASDVIQIAILYIVIYLILKSAKGSRFGQALMGFGLLAALLTAFAYLFHFDVLTRIVQFLLVYIAVSTVVIMIPVMLFVSHTPEFLAPVASVNASSTQSDSARLAGYSSGLNGLPGVIQIAIAPLT